MDMGEVYDDLGHPADYYSTVDHHYNYYGAYAAYRSILDTLAADGWDLPVLTEEDFTFRELPNPTSAPATVSSITSGPTRTGRLSRS